MSTLPADAHCVLPSDSPALAPGRVNETDIVERRLYAKRDHIAQGDHYLRHVSAMTGEGLHAKSAIAAELAHRDIEIERLRAALAERDVLRNTREVMARWMAEACGVLFSVEEEAEDGGDSLRMLRERGLRLVRAVIHPKPGDLAPWLEDGAAPTTAAEQKDANDHR